MKALIRFATDYVSYVLKGGMKFYAWMGALALLMVAMLYVFYLQPVPSMPEPRSRNSVQRAPGSRRATRVPSSCAARRYRLRATSIRSASSCSN